jgi:hypothetical protein
MVLLRCAKWNLYRDPGFQSVHALQLEILELFIVQILKLRLNSWFGLGLSRKVYRDFEVGVNYNFAEFKYDQAKDPSFEAFGFTKHKKS